MPKIPDLPPYWLTTTQIATMMDCTGHRVRQLTDDGVISTGRKSGKGRYNLPDVFVDYVAYVNKRLNARDRKERDAESESLYLEARARRENEKACMAALEHARLRNELIPAEEVEFVITDIVLKMKAQLDGLRNRAPMALTGITSKSEMYAAAGREIDAVLNEMADYRYDPEDFKRHKSATEDDSDEDEPKPVRPRKKAAKKTAAKKKTKQN